MKRIILFLCVAGALYVYNYSQQPPATYAEPAATATAAASWRPGQQVSGSGEVVRILSDDNEGSRHQRFILQLSSGRTLLIAHNIDLAPRISGLRTGDTVSFYGEFEPNPQGGVIHWTHHDPQGRHVGGWLEHRGRRYE